jgi:mannan endo-1,4-beta-mannosidase
MRSFHPFYAIAMAASLAALSCATSSCANPLQPTIDPALPITPSDPALVAAREATLAKLVALKADALIASGQNVGHVGWSLTAGSMRVGSRTPSVLALDLGYGDLSGDFSEAIDMLASHASSGGMVELSFHPPNPASSGDAWDKAPVDFGRLSTPGDPLNAAFMGIISNLGNILQLLEDRGVIAFLRPLHEMNGGWFWWGNDEAWPDPADWIRLWRSMHDYLRQERALDNVLFVYCPNSLYAGGGKPVSYYYPGSAYVDVIGLDYYGDTLDGFDDLGALDEVAALGKPLGMFEVGSDSHHAGFDHRLWAGLRDFGATSFIVWHSWPGHALSLADCSYGEELLAMPEVLDAEEWSAR